MTNGGNYVCGMAMAAERSWLASAGVAGCVAVACGVAGSATVMYGYS
jgi:hypothetical protein